MKRCFEASGRFVATRPVVTMAGALAVTVVAVAWMSLTGDQAAEADACVPEWL